jgi:hypothetical protein
MAQGYHHIDCMDRATSTPFAKYGGVLSLAMLEPIVILHGQDVNAILVTADDRTLGQDAYTALLVDLASLHESMRITEVNRCFFGYRYLTANADPENVAVG